MNFLLLVKEFYRRLGYSVLGIDPKRMTNENPRSMHKMEFLLKMFPAGNQKQEFAQLLFE
jgi:hypothetical protein